MSSAPRTEEDPTWTMLVVVVVFGLIGWAVWYMFRVQILGVMRYLRLAELGVAGLFSHRYAACFDWLRQAPVSDQLPSMRGAQLANACFGEAYINRVPENALNYYNLSGDSMAAIGRLTGLYMRWIYIAVFACVGVYAMFFTPRNKFKTRHNLESFIKVQAGMWPVISPIANFDPATLSARIPGTEVPDKLPIFAEALSPEEWVAWCRIGVTNGIPDRDVVRRVFIQQLGPRWTGIQGQPLYVQALFAAFSLKGVQRREESDNLLGRISTCWTVDKGFRVPAELQAEIGKLVADPAVGGEGEKVAAQYAYRTTALLGLLKWARWMGGVLASAQFLWLRGQDRVLWYPLNNVGRRSFHTEGAGAMAHFMAEQNAKKPLPIPRVDTAIVTLNKYLSENNPPIPPRAEPGGKRA